MTGEYMEKRVADLVVGDEVRDYGTVVSIETVMGEGWREVRGRGVARLMMLAHARVDVRRPVEVTVKTSADNCHYYESVWVNAHFVAEFVNSDFAEEFAERLRGSADERRKALGQ